MNNIKEKSIQEQWFDLAISGQMTRDHINSHFINNSNDLKNIDNNKILMMASAYGYIEVVQYLVENGTDINFENKYGWNALTTSIIYRNFNIFEYLLQFYNIDNKLISKLIHIDRAVTDNGNVVNNIFNKYEVLKIIINKYKINKNYINYLLIQLCEIENQHSLINKIIKLYYNKELMKTKRLNLTYDDIKFKLTIL